MNKRNTNADIIRIFAFFMVLLVHTFLNSNFHLEKIEGPLMLTGLYFRQFALICTPLFIMLTGYLYAGKEISFTKEYFKKSLRFLVPYGVVTIITYLVGKTYGILREETTLLKMFLGAEDNGYSWYIEMYFGLFLMIPFINTAWNSLKSKKEKQNLVAVAVVLCFIPTIIMAIGLDFPNFWLSMYPIGYYIAGVYIKEFGLPISKKIKIVTLLFSSLSFFLMAFWLFKDNLFQRDNAYHNIFCFINTILTFSLLLDINTSKYKDRTRKFLSKISEIILPAYLISYVTDLFIYKMFVMNYFETMKEKLIFAPAFILISAICSLTLGKIITVISNKILSIRRKKI